MKNNSKLKVGIAGAAGEARLYLNDYFLSDIAEVTIVQDIDEERLDKIAEQFRIPVKTNRYEELIDSDVDIIDVSTPNYLHARQTIAALRAGKDVLVQKPMAPTIEECEAMISAAEQNKKKLGVYMSSLNDPLNHDIKKMIGQGFFGTISSVRVRGAHLGGLNLKKKKDLWRSSVEKTGGGSFIQLAVHGIHTLEWMMEHKIIRVASFSKNLMCKDQLEGDDITTAIGEFDNGANVTVESSYCALGGMFEIYGSEGYLVSHSNEITIYSQNEFRGEVLAHPGNKIELKISNDSLKDNLKKVETKYNQHQAFLRAVKDGSIIPTPGEDGLRGLKIVKAVYESANSGRMVLI